MSANLSNKTELVAQQLASALSVRNVWGNLVYNVLDSGGTYNSASIQRAIDNAMRAISTTAMSGEQTVLSLEVVLPSGTYNINSKITINTMLAGASTKNIDAVTVSIRGASRNSAVLIADPSLVGDMIDVVHGSVDISELKFIGNGNVNGIRLGRQSLSGGKFQVVSGSDFSKLLFYNCNKGIVVGCAWDSKFTDINFSSPLGTNPIGIDILPHDTDNSNNLTFNRCHAEPSYTGTLVRAIGVSSSAGYHHGLNFDNFHYETRSYATTIMELKSVRFVHIKSGSQLTQNNDAASGATLADIVPMIKANDVSMMSIEGANISVVAGSATPLNNKMIDLAGKCRIVIRHCGILNGVANSNNSVDSLWQSNATTPFVTMPGEDAILVEHSFINDFYLPASRPSYAYLPSRIAKNKKWAVQYNETNDNLALGYGSASGDLTNNAAFQFSNDGMLRAASFAGNFMQTITNGASVTFSPSFNNNPNKRGLYIVYGDTSGGDIYAIFNSTGAAIVNCVTPGAGTAVGNANPATAGKLNIYLSGTSIGLNNLTGGDRRVGIMVLPFY